MNNAHSDLSARSYPIRFGPPSSSSSLSSAGRNPFVELAIFYALRLASELTSPEQVRARLSSSGTSSSQSPLQGLSSEPGSLPGIDIWVLGDNDFYSQRATVLISSLSEPAYIDAFFTLTEIFSSAPLSSHLMIPHPPQAHSPLLPPPLYALSHLLPPKMYPSAKSTKQAWEAAPP